MVGVAVIVVVVGRRSSPRTWTGPGSKVPTHPSIASHCSGEVRSGATYWSTGSGPGPRPTLFWGARGQRLRTQDEGVHWDRTEVGKSSHLVGVVPELCELRGGGGRWRWWLKRWSSSARVAQAQLDEARLLQLPIDEPSSSFGQAHCLIGLGALAPTHVRTDAGPCTVT